LLGESFVKVNKMSKSVSWKISPRDRFIRSAPTRKSDIGISRREQPTWANCKSDRPIASPQFTRSNSPMTSSASNFTARSVYSINFLTSSENVPVTEIKRGRELLRKKAFSQLKLNFPSKFTKFDSSDLKAKANVSSAKSRKTKTYSETAKEVITFNKSQSRFYMLNGVPSQAYRRPSIQFADQDAVVSANQKRRLSEPALPTYIGEKESLRPETLSTISGKCSPDSPSTSAPATIASNDESIKTVTKQEDPEYLKRDWKSDILSRYSVAEPWRSKYRTNRYFPKFNNFQDLHCKNPYLVPNGLLFDTADR